MRDLCLKHPNINKFTTMIMMEEMKPENER